jgi:hypothetical protein
MPGLLLRRLLLLLLKLPVKLLDTQLLLRKQIKVLDAAAAAAAVSAHLRRRHFVHDAVARLAANQDAPHCPCCSNAQALW